MTLKAGTLAPKCPRYVRLDSPVDFLAHHLANGGILGSFRGQAEPLLKGHIGESVALVGSDFGERFRQRIRDGSKALFSCARSFFCVGAHDLFTSQTLARNRKQRFFGPFPVFDVGTCAVPTENQSLLIAERIVPDQEPEIPPSFPRIRASTSKGAPSERARSRAASNFFKSSG